MGFFLGDLKYSLHAGFKSPTHVNDPISFKLHVWQVHDNLNQGWKDPTRTSRQQLEAAVDSTNPPGHGVY